MTEHAGWKNDRSGGGNAYLHPTLGRVEQIQNGRFAGRWTATNASGETKRNAQQQTAYFMKPRYARQALGSNE